MDNRSIQDNTDALLGSEGSHHRGQRSAELRQQMVAARMALSAGAWKACSTALAGHLAAHLSKLGLPQRGQCVAFCWPIQNEPDLRPLVREWTDQIGIVPALPVVIAPGQPLKFRVWQPSEVLALDRYGIPTPSSGDWVQPDLICLPGNAFDDAGYRLGYGGGFFDRTLAALHPRPMVIGLCFEFARLRTIAPQAHDQPVDALVTERGVYPVLFNESAGG